MTKNRATHAIRIPSEHHPALQDSINQLRRVGLVPSDKQVHYILEAGDAAVQPLLHLASDVKLFEQDEPGCFGPLHALRLLGELHPLEMIEPLAALIPLDLSDADEDLVYLWLTELPQCIARIGVPALEQLWTMADDERGDVGPRSLAIVALSYLAAAFPDQKAEIIAGLRERMASCTDKMLRSYLALELSRHGVSELYPQMMTLYRESAIDTGLFPAKTARQFLLGKGDPTLENVNVPLWDRYQYFGPFPAEEDDDFDDDFDDDEY